MTAVRVTRYMLVIIYVLLGITWYMIFATNQGVRGNMELINRNQINSDRKFDTVKQEHKLIINDLDTVKSILRHGKH
jgi:hypothetical protein